MLQLRPFGTAQGDLAIDFGAHNTASLVTRLLAGCTADAGTRVPAEVYRELSAGKRLECLLRLAAGESETPLSLVCRCTVCGADLELELTIDELASLQREADAHDVVVVELLGERVTFRKPTGRDLEAWGDMFFRDERAAAAAMIAGLAVDRGSFDPGKLESFGAIEAALDEADPLTDFTCRVQCGECGEANDCAVDLMETALGMLKRSQHELVVALHRLASHYHWTEQEIFAVPDWRRQQYLQLIAASGR